jgi:hypothetical protein
VLLLIFLVFHIVSVHSKGGTFHNVSEFIFTYKSLKFQGYEKLVMPLIARLSSNGSLASEQVAEGDETKEWMWIPKNQMDNVSVGMQTLKLP